MGEINLNSDSTSNMMNINAHQNQQNTTSVKLNNVFLLLIDILIFLAKFLNEMFLATIRLFIGDGLKDISGEFILITGTGHGIGKELAIQYADMECNVICIDIDEATNNETVREINAMNKGEAFGYICDVTDREKVFELAEKVKTEVGLVSVIVNNAGIMPCHQLDQTNPKLIQKLFDLNVIAHFWILQAFMPHLKAQNRGHVIALSSMAGLVGLSNLVPYCATKFAVRGLMEAMDIEIRENSNQYNIKFTTVFPYMVDTGLCKKPKTRFPKILGLITAKTAATSIIDAQRRNLREACIPRYFYHMNNIARALPDKCGFAIKDFLDSGVEAEE